MRKNSKSSKIQDFWVIVPASLLGHEYNILYSTKGKSFWAIAWDVVCMHRHFEGCELLFFKLFLKYNSTFSLLHFSRLFLVSKLMLNLTSSFALLSQSKTPSESWTKTSSCLISINAKYQCYSRLLEEISDLLNICFWCIKTAMKCTQI